MRKVWMSFLEMSIPEALSGAVLGAILAFVLGYVALGLDTDKQFWYVLALNVFIIVGCMALIAWARIQPPPDIDNRPESKREP